MSECDIDGVLVFGFGGPEPGCCERRPDCPRDPGCEAACFVRKVLEERGAGVDEERVAEVTAHYHELGGFSPFNELARLQTAALEQALRERGFTGPVLLGLRHWRPWYDEALEELAAAGCRRLGLVILSAQHSGTGWDFYRERIDERHAADPDRMPRVQREVAPACLLDGYVTACADRLREVTADWDGERRAGARLVFTAHAIPQPAERASPYRAEFAACAARIAAAAGWAEHHLAFQSAPDRSRVPWSAPRVEDLLGDLAAAGATEVVLQAAGFLVDHVEVVYDLDREAAAGAAALGLGFQRAACAGAHPALIAEWADSLLALHR